MTREEMEMSLVNNLIADGLRERNERLVAALRDAHALIPNELVGPWVAAHNLDGVLGIGHQQRAADKLSHPTECPKCKASMDGGPIPDVLRDHYSPPHRWCRAIWVKINDKDRDHWQCPDCKHEWR